MAKVAETIRVPSTRVVSRAARTAAPRSTQNRPVPRDPSPAVRPNQTVPPRQAASATAPAARGRPVTSTGTCYHASAESPARTTKARRCRAFGKYELWGLDLTGREVAAERGDEAGDDDRDGEETGVDLVHARSDRHAFAQV